MTLLELLGEAADVYDARGIAGDYSRARALREARERLREEMERADKRYGLAKETPANLDGMPLLIHGAIHEVLRRINHGPDPAPRVPQPESPPDPFQAVLAIDCPKCSAAAGTPCDQWEPDLSEYAFCASRLRAASRRDTP